MNNLRHSINRTFSCSRWMRGIFSVTLLAVALTLSGCLSKPALNRETFVFNAPVITNEVVGARVLGIKSLQISPPFGGRALVYRTGEYTYQRDPYAEFLSHPAELMVAPVGEMLLSGGCFSAVVEPTGAMKPDTLVQITINELYGDIRKPESPEAVLALNVIFINATNGIPGSVILSKNYSCRIPMKSSAPGALMDAWNKGLIKIFTEVVSDFHQKETEISDRK